MADAKLFAVLVLLEHLTAYGQQQGNKPAFFQVAAVEKPHQTAFKVLAGYPAEVIPNSPRALLANERGAHVRAVRILILPVSVPNVRQHALQVASKCLALVRLHHAVKGQHGVNRQVWFHGNLRWSRQGAQPPLTRRRLSSPQ